MEKNKTPKEDWGGMVSLWKKELMVGSAHCLGEECLLCKDLCKQSPITILQLIWELVRTGVMELILQVRKLAFREVKPAPLLSESRDSIGTRSSSCLLFCGITCWAQFYQVTRSTGNKTEGRAASLVTFCELGPLLQIFPPSLRWESRAPFPGEPALMTTLTQVFTNLLWFPTFTFSSYSKSTGKNKKQITVETADSFRLLDTQTLGVCHLIWVQT